MQRHLYAKPRVVCALGVESLVFDPCANRPETGDFVSVMGDNVKRLEAAYWK